MIRSPRAGRRRPVAAAVFAGLLLSSMMALTACFEKVPTLIMNEVAERYVKLVLAVGRHDEDFVDAYYGPAEWKAEAEQGEPIPVKELLAQADLLVHQVQTAKGPRHDFLEEQLVAVHAYLLKLDGKSMSLAEQAEHLYDIEPQPRDVAEFERAIADVEALLPGDGSLRERVQAFRETFRVPADRLSDVADAILAETRKRTAALRELPEGERFETSFVSDKPWSAYNWYKGDLHSLIEINTDLPIELPSYLHTLSHEGYPGHHTFNSLIEKHMVMDRGWIEYTVYPLFSPQSLIAEGTAEAGVGVIFSDEERVAFLQDVLAPLAGLEDLDFAKYDALSRAMAPLKYVRPEAARMLLDEGAAEEDVAAFMVRFGLVTEDRARKYIDFIRRYGAYVYNYPVGEDLVNEHLAKQPDRVAAYFEILMPEPIVEEHETRSGPRAWTPSRLAGKEEPKRRRAH